jgi:hypothetical protein
MNILCDIAAPSSIELVFILVVTPILLSIYFIPSIVAFSRKKANKTAILVLNLFFGCTGVGWVILLVWALSAEKIDQPER